MRTLIKEAEENAKKFADSECDEILFTPENKYGTPYPEGSEMSYDALRELSLKRPASMLIQ